MLNYGRVVEEVGYKNGEIVNRIRRTEESIPVANKQQLFDIIFQQLTLLKTCKVVNFQVYADKHSHEPNRIVVVSEE